MYLDLFNKDILVVGCGNPLLGDDGFGPAVIESLEMQQIQADHIGLLDAGTSVRELLFDLLLSSPIPKTLILIDAVQHSIAGPGDIITIDVDQIPENKVADYSLHQFPTTNMLKELKDSGLIDIKIYADRNVLDELVYGIEKLEDQLSPDGGKVLLSTDPGDANLLLIIDKQKDQNKEKKPE